MEAWFRRAAAFQQMRDPRNALLDLEEATSLEYARLLTYAISTLQHEVAGTSGTMMHQV